MINCDCIKSYYRLIAVNFRRQKELDAELDAIQEMELAGHLKDNDGLSGNGAQLMFVLTTLEKKRIQTYIFSRKCNSLIKDVTLWRSKSWFKKYTTKQIGMNDYLINYYWQQGKK